VRGASHVQRAAGQLISLGPMASIRITSIPPGEAPVAVRSAWVGVELPLTRKNVAANDTGRGGSAIDVRTTRHPSYRICRIIRKRIEEPFDWGKTIGRIRQTVFRGLQRVDQQFKLAMTANNLMRLARVPMAVPSGAAP